jgi:hypothetical protein
VIRVELSEREVRATVCALGFVRDFLAQNAVELEGAPVADLAAAHARLSIELARPVRPVRDTAFEAMGVREFERRSWDPRTAAQPIGGGG